MFDTIFGLPVHALVLHATVILLPLLALVTAAAVVRESWRARYGAAAAAVAVAMLALALVTRQSGYALFERIGEPEFVENHRDYANVLVLIVLAFAVLAVATWLVQRAGWQRAAAGLSLLVALVALGTVVQTVVVGHSGSTAVWKGVVEATEPG